MEDKRRHKRLDLKVSIELERIDEDDVTTLKYINVDVTDISHSGIGFKCKQKLEIGTHYNTKIQIWTKEVLDGVIEVVRMVDEEEGYKYGGKFIALSETDSLRIDIYQFLNDK